MLGVCVLAALGCDDAWSFSPAVPGLRNASEFETAFALRYSMVPVRCDEASDADAAMREGDFSAPVVVVLERGDSVSLEPPGDLGTVADAGVSLNPSECGAAFIRADGSEPNLVRWDLREPAVIEGSHWQVVPPGAVYAERFGDALRLAPGPGVFVFPWENVVE